MPQFFFVLAIFKHPVYTRSILLHEQVKKIFIHENEGCCNHQM
jgi:hypothetical protein